MQGMDIQLRSYGRCLLQEAIRNLIAEGFPVQQVLLELQTAVLAEVGLHTQHSRQIYEETSSKSFTKASYFALCLQHAQQTDQNQPCHVICSLLYSCACMANPNHPMAATMANCQSRSYAWKRPSNVLRSFAQAYSMISSSLSVPSVQFAKLLDRGTSVVQPFDLRPSHKECRCRLQDGVRDLQRARICHVLGEADKCLADGSDEFLQLLSVASQVQQTLCSVA